MKNEIITIVEFLMLLLKLDEEQQKEALRHALAMVKQIGEWVN